MHLFLKQRLASSCLMACTMAAGLLLAVGAQAADGHGDASHDEPRASGARASGSRPSDIKLPGKPAPLRKGADKLSARDAADAEADLARREASPEVKTTVSMSELRDLIDQKIAEVRAQRQPAPVVRLRPKAKPVAKKPAPEQHASLGAAAQDGHGALLPLPGDHGHAHDAVVGGRAVNPLGRDVHWAYSGDTGPENWGRLKPEFQLCARGKRQSPIDIRDGIAVQLDPIQFDYRPSGFRVIDNGHTVQVNVEPGNAIVVQGNRYELQQFHFHRPSEERINGRQFEMVAHLVHKDLEGRVAVVAVLMDAGKGHPLVQQVWNNLPLEKRIEQAGLTPMDLTLLLPTQRQYYTYMGSLTTPPCSEGVLWMVMKHPATVSREQIAVFGKLYPMNARPIQSASGRLIKEGQ